MSESSLPLEDVSVYRHIIAQLERLPREAFTRLKYFQPQIGCYNRCAFCSQSAGYDIWQFSKRGLRIFIAAVAHVTQNRLGTIGGERYLDRPKTIFPYLDNDISSYQYLDEYIRCVWENLGVQVRMSTVGYSSLNDSLQSMHKRIARELAPAINGIRFSFTPYTFGWTTVAEQNGFTSRSQFVKDFGNLLRTYRPLVDSIGAGKETARVELRFSPLIVTYPEQLTDTWVDGHHVIRIGPHLLISQTATDARPLLARINGLDHGVPVFSEQPARYFFVTSDTRVSTAEWEQFTKRLIFCRFNNSESLTHCASHFAHVYLLKNIDGYYYAVDPVFQPDGTFRALHIYPRTTQRRVSGYIDATRFFLNTIIQYKSAHGLSKQKPFIEATSSDINAILKTLEETKKTLSRIDLSAANHLANDVIPLVQGYANSINLSGYPESMFFDPHFTIDTGQIVNQGRAKGLFRGLVSLEDVPMSPWEERAFGHVGKVTERGRIWRIAPLPFYRSRKVSEKIVGRKNIVYPKDTIQVQELDARSLYPIDSGTGKNE
jgi:hypothetical protein